MELKILIMRTLLQFISYKKDNKFMKKFQFFTYVKVYLLIAEGRICLDLYAN